MSDFVKDNLEGNEPSDSTKIELKVDAETAEKGFQEQITSQIDAPEHVDVMHREKIDELRKIMSPEMNAEFSDRDCERFLIARNLDIQKSYEKLKKRFDWYNAPFTNFKIDNPTLRPRDLGHTLTDTKEEIFSREFPCSNLGEDKEGHPIYWEKSGYVASNWSTIKKHFSHDELTVRHIRQQEIFRQRCRLATLRHNKLIEKQIVVMDLKGVPVFVEWACFKSLKEVITIDEGYYPETLKNLFVINAPVYFTALWAIVKPWLDPLTIQKIQIFGDNYYPHLSKYIDEEMIPVEYGGKNNTFSWVSPTNLVLE